MSETIPCPSGLSGRIRGMKAREERILADRKLAHLGELMRQRSRFNAAAEEFAKAYVRVGNRSPALSNRYAQTLVKLKDLAKAEQLLSASLKPFPVFPKTHQTLAEIYLATGRPSDAERSLLEVVAVDPFDPLPHKLLFQIYSERKDETKVAREQKAMAALAGRDVAPSSEGVIIVRSHPYARVFLDGPDTGRTTPAQLRAAPGSHLVKLVNEERGFAREAPVELASGEEKLVEVLLDVEAAPDAGAK